MNLKLATSPPTDDSGYAVRPEDLAFLGLEVSDIAALAERIHPLGMTAEQYSYMCTEVLHALDREGIMDADVRLQGSSARFFSSPHKRMPYSIEEIANLLQSGGGEMVEAYRCGEIANRIIAQWPSGQPRPKSRPFDSMYIVKATDQRSDYDLQISSDQMLDIVTDEIARGGFKVEHIRSRNTHYDFVLKCYSEEFFPHVGIACGRVSRRVGRPVTWALFPSGGPRENATNPSLSSHFRSDDWIISTRTGQDE